jgi:hypothetical protein
VIDIQESHLPQGSSLKLSQNKAIAITLARVVLPVPGGPERIYE